LQGSTFRNTFRLENAKSRKVSTKIPEGFRVREVDWETRRLVVGRAGERVVNLAYTQRCNHGRGGHLVRIHQLRKLIGL
jgi:hypothetical protein